MHKWVPVLALLLAGSPTFAAENGHPLSMWQIDGASNSIYLLGSIHMLREKDHPIPSAIYDAYSQAVLYQPQISRERLVCDRIDIVHIDLHD